MTAIDERSEQTDQRAARRSLAWPAALIGALAGLAGIAAGHLVAALIEPEASPLLAVGSAVIDLTPTPVKEWAVATLGTADKPVLLGLIALVALGVCSTAGVLARRRMGLAAGLIGGLGVLVVIAAMSRPVATVASLLPGLVAGAVGIAVLRWLTARDPDRVAVDPWASPRSTGSDLLDLDRPLVRRAGEPSRRAFLAGGATILGASVVAVTVGEVLIRRTLGATDIELPPVPDPPSPLPAGLEKQIDGITPFVTENSDFYRIDTALTVPAIKVDDWELTIDGDVEAPYTLRYADLSDFEVIERDITMVCVSNEVGGGYIGSARWTGVRVADVLAKAQVRGSADQILSTDVSGMTISTPVQALTDGRDALLAIGMNGEPLPRAHGFPVRLVTPGLYGFVGSTKWVTRLTATTYAKDVAYWTEREWAIDAPVLTQSRIDTPAPNTDVDAGKKTHIGGVAWAQGRGITKVEVRIDDEPWQEAVLGPDAGIDYWKQWYVEWTPSKGEHTLRVRATDGTGTAQTEAKATPFPSGATGLHTITVTAS